MMYGIAPGPTIWQREIEKILQGIPGVAIFFDDIVITGSTDEEHLTRLEEVLSKLHKFNVRINLEKSKFFLDKVDYCGYVVNRVGIHKDNRKIEAIQKMPRPKNVSEIRAFTGMINYYGRFIRNLSSILHPLNKLLQKGVPFVWSRDCETAFNKAKAVFTSNQVLAHFNPKLPLVLATDASSYGVGAVLSHRYPDGSERVIQFASQTFSNVQLKYSQIDKEAFAIIFGVKKFVQFLYGNNFTLITDHKPLVQIFSPSQSLPIYSAMRMQHYAIFLQGFNYKIEYRSSEKHANADCLSRLPVDTPQTVADVVDAYQLEIIETLPVTAKKIAYETQKDKDVSELLEALQTGKIIHKTKRFNIEQNEFSLQNNVIMRGSRVYVPKILRTEILKELHSGHFGIVKMKNLARSHCWWPAIDKDIEKLVRNCANCNSHKNNPPKVEVHLWEAPSAPMQRVHIDFAGPFMGKMFLLVVDAFSKWPEVHIVRDITAKTTITKCREIFAAYGIPQVVVTDNGRSFTSAEFQKFLHMNGIKHKRTSPFNPATNGQVERFVQTCKQALKRMNCDATNVNFALSKLLLQYRTMPHATTNKTPAEMFLNRKISTRLDLIIPEQNNSKSYDDSTGNLKAFTRGERVACRNYSGSVKWKFGIVSERKGKLHYSIRLDDGRSWERHANQMRRIGENTPTSCLENDYYYWDSEESREPECPSNSAAPSTENLPDAPQSAAPVSSQSNTCVEAGSELETPRRSTRCRKRPDFLFDCTAKYSE